MNHQINHWTVFHTYTSDTVRTHKIYLNMQYKLCAKCLFTFIRIMTMMISKANNSSNFYGILIVYKHYAKNDM